MNGAAGAFLYYPASPIVLQIAKSTIQRRLSVAADVDCEYCSCLGLAEVVFAYVYICMYGIVAAARWAKGGGEARSGAVGAARGSGG